MAGEPAPGFAISQDNIGGPLSRIGAGGHGQYCDFCSARSFHHLFCASLTDG